MIIRSLVVTLSGALLGFFYGRASSEKSQQLDSLPLPGWSLRAQVLLGVESDPAATLAKLEWEVANSESYHQSGNYQALFSRWAELDLEGAALALEKVNQKSLRCALGALLDVAFEQNPERAAEILLRWGHLHLLPQWLKDHPAEACRLVPQLVLLLDGQGGFSFPVAWAKNDPEAALEWVRSIPGAMRGYWLKELQNAPGVE